MSRAILQFELPAEADEFAMANSGSSLYAAIGEYSSRLRSMYKHEGRETIDTFEARNLLFECLREYDININLI